MIFSNIESRVLDWARERDIFKESTDLRQYDKLMEEAEELLMALKDNRFGNVVDAIGDMLVVLTIIAHFNSVNLGFCFNTAYVAIRDRKGKMVDGVFVKEE